jgi:hypothetical protein
MRSSCMSSISKPPAKLPEPRVKTSNTIVQMRHPLQAPLGIGFPHPLRLSPRKRRRFDLWLTLGQDCDVISLYVHDPTDEMGNVHGLPLLVLVTEILPFMHADGGERERGTT